jgi:tetratricopeptide (TPR) repeat protein
MIGRIATAFVCLLSGTLPLAGQEAWRDDLAKAEELRKERRFDDAERMFQTAIQEARRLEPDWVVGATTYNNLGILYGEMRKCDLAIRALRRSVDLWKKAGAAGEPYLVRTANHLVAQYLECHAVGDAEREYRALLAPVVAAPAGAGDANLARAIANRAGIEYEKHRYVEAQKSYEQALAVRERISSEPSTETAILLNNIAHLLLHAGDAEQALVFSRRAAATFEAAAGPSDPIRINGLINHACLCVKTLHWAEAEPQLDRALASARSAVGDEHPMTAGAMACYAELLKKTHRNKEGSVMQSRASEIMARSRAGTTRETVDVLEFSRGK